MTSPSWSKIALSIAAMFSFRMLGLFMLIPVFSVLGEQLHGATPILLGIALGSYGLSQGCLQMPFGWLSDRLGRKPIIALGFVLFILGSLLGALTQSIYGMIAARILQGMGAVGSVLIALLADLTSDSERMKSMAIIGASIGSSFVLAMIVSPFLAHFYGLSSIFYLTFVLGVIGLIILYTVVPTPKKESFHAESGANPALFRTVLTNASLQRLNAGIFAQHFILTASFFVVPLILQKQIESQHLQATWHFYFPLLIGSFLLMIPFIVLAERRQQMRHIFISAIAMIFVTTLCLSIFFQHFLIFSLSLFLYFIAFNFLEAALPSLISRLAPRANKGTAMGVYSTSQFLGLFFGGAFSGFIYQHGGITGVFLMNACISFIWLIVSFPIELPIRN